MICPPPPHPSFLFHCIVDRHVVENAMVLAYGSRVLLTKNQKALTPLGLNDGAIGTVISILNTEGNKPPNNPEVVVVDFPKYSGPCWLQDHPTWLLITLNEARCEDHCCTREGFPLIPEYGISIAKSQGTTIGRSKQITHVVIKLNRKIDMEKLILGTAYTAFSRVCEDQWRAGQVGPGGHGPTDDFDHGGAPELWGRQNHWTSKIFDSSDFSDTLASSSLHCPLVIVRIDFLILAMGHTPIPTIEIASRLSIVKLE